MRVARQLDMFNCLASQSSIISFILLKDQIFVVLTVVYRSALLVCPFIFNSCLFVFVNILTLVETNKLLLCVCGIYLRVIVPGRPSSKKIAAVESRWRQCVHCTISPAWDLKPRLPTAETNALPLDQLASPKRSLLLLLHRTRVLLFCFQLRYLFLLELLKVLAVFDQAFTVCFRFTLQSREPSFWCLWFDQTGNEPEFLIF